MLEKYTHPHAFFPGPGPHSLLFSQRPHTSVPSLFFYIFKMTISTDLAPSAYQTYVGFSYIKISFSYLLMGYCFISSPYSSSSLLSLHCLSFSPSIHSSAYCNLASTPITPLHLLCSSQHGHRVAKSNESLSFLFISLCSNRPYWPLSLKYFSSHRFSGPTLSWLFYYLFIYCLFLAFSSKFLSGKKMLEYWYVSTWLCFLSKGEGHARECLLFPISICSSHSSSIRPGVLTGLFRE